METPREYHYTYYSYEEWGMGYFGSRSCECLPEEDIKYFGSYRDKTFKPTQKVILKSDYATREEAYADEIILHNFYKVDENPHFANRAKQTSTKFYYTLTPEQAKQNGKKGSKKSKELRVGIFSMTSEELSRAAKKGAKLGGKRGSKTQRERKSGIFGFTEEERKNNGRKGAKTQEKLGIGLYGLNKEQRKENVKITNSQKWMCLETGYTSTAAGVVLYQKARGIDTSKRIRIEECDSRRGVTQNEHTTLNRVFYLY